MTYTTRLISLALAGPALALAQTLPAPPVSPAPVVNYEYDAQGNPTRTIQAPGGLNLTTTNSYDKLQRATQTLDAKAGKMQYGYDGQDNLTKVTDPRSLATQYPRNGLGDATQLISPDTGTASHTYDAAGNLKTRTDSRGVLATYTYDAMNRLTKVVYSQSGQTSLSFGSTFDQTGTGFSYGVGRLTTSTHPAGSTRYQYNAQGRLTQLRQVVNAAAGANSAALTQTIGYGYDAAGRISSITYPSGRQLRITYTQGEPSAIGLANTAAASTATPMLSAIQWQAFGPAAGWQWQMNSGTLAHSRVFDTNGRLVRYPLGSIIRDLSFDAADRITSYTHYTSTGTAQPALDQGFGYDELGRLTQVTTASASWSITYDANGNRTGVTLNGTPNTYTTATASNRLTGMANPVEGFGYDNAGNTTSRTGPNAYTATFNLANRLTTLTKSGATSSYTYNTQGQRIRKYISAGTGAGAASTILFVYDQAGQLLGEYDSTGKAIREYVWLGNTPVGIFKPDPANAANPPLIYYIHADHLNTPRVVFDKANTLRWRWLAEPFGTTAPELNPSGTAAAFTQPLRFPGQYHDTESGLFYNYFRDYDASIGRYVESDPIGLAGGINTFAYVGGNPLSFVDPNGLSRLTIEYVDGRTVITENPSGASLISTVNSAADGSITRFQLMGHGNQYTQCISKGSSCSDTLTQNLNVQSNGRQIGSVKDILRRKMSSAGQVQLEGCNNASGQYNITRSISEILQDIPVTGGSGYQLGYEDHWLFGNSSGSIGPKQTYINGNPK